MLRLVAVRPPRLRFLVFPRKGAWWLPCREDGVITRPAATAARKQGDGVGAGSIPAHLSYDPDKVDDMATLLLMARSAAASDYQTPSFWRSCSLQVQRLFTKVKVAELAVFVEVVATARYRDDELMYNFGDAVIEGVDTLDADTVGTTLHAHALLGFRNDRALCRLEAMVLQMMQESKMTAAALSRTMWSLAKLFSLQVVSPPSRELLEASVRMITEHVSAFSMVQLVQVLDAFAEYSVQQKGDQQTSAMLAAVGGVLAREYKRLSAAHCSSAVRAFAKVRVHDERLLSAVSKRLRDNETRGALSAEELSQLLYGLAKFSCQDTALLDLLSIEGRRRLHDMDIPLVSSTLASLAKAGIASQVLTNRAAVKLRQAPTEDLDAASIQVLVNLSMAFGKLQAFDQKLFNVIGDAFMRRPAELFESTSCVELVQIVHAFTKVHVVHEPLFRGLTLTLADRFDEISLQDVVKFLHGAAKVEFPLPVALQERIAEVLQVENVGKLSVFELLKISTATRRVGLEIPALETQLGSVLPHEAKSGDFSMARPKALFKKRRKSARKRKWTW